MKNTYRFLIFILLIISCNSKGELEKPIREISIPKGAFRVGDSENGYYFKIEKICSNKNNVKILILSGRNGVRFDSKWFSLVCPKDNQTSIQNLASEIESFEGEKIYLKSGFLKVFKNS